MQTTQTCAVRSYTKANGKVGYELVKTTIRAEAGKDPQSTEEVLMRDDSHLVLRQMRERPQNAEPAANIGEFV